MTTSNTNFSNVVGAYPFSQNDINGIFNKSLTDKNNYHHLVLENGLRVLLINDPQAERFAASLSVNVGNFQDPPEQQGLAHFLEHMLFLGTEKYPEAGDYQGFINTNGGSHNAYTSTNTTNFYFDIKPSAFEGALDRFSQFFISPLFSESLTQREKNAVDAEYKAKLKDEGRRNGQALKTLINPEHPYSDFTVGNLDTLKDRPNSPLREQLLNMYNAYYHSSNMALVLVANMPYQKMANLAKRYFVEIPQKEPKKAADFPALLTDKQPQLQFMRPLVDGHTLKFYYQIDAQEQNYKTQPTRYLSHILGNENKGSLYASLKSDGFINGLSAGLTADYGNNALFVITIRLTNEGMDNINVVAKRFFATLSLLQSTPINPMYLEEGLQLSQLMFNHQNYVNPQDLARSLSAKMLTIPYVDILSCFRLDTMADTQQVRRLLQQLTPENLLVQVISKKDMPENWASSALNWQTEKWYHSQYSNHFFSADFLNEIQTSVQSTHVSLPEKNRFIPTSLALIDEHQDTPSIVFEKDGFVYWNKSDAEFGKPTAMTFLALRYDHAADTERNTLLNRLWTRLFNDSVSESTYAPYVAGLGYSLYPHSNGLTLRTSGYSDKQNTYNAWLIDQLFLFRPNLARFEQAKIQLSKDLSNQKSRQAYHNASSALTMLITKNSFTIEQLEATLPSLTFDDLQGYIKAARQQFSVVGYSTGNITKEQTQAFADSVYQRFVGRLIAKDPIKIETKPLTTQTKHHYQFESTSDDSVVLYALLDTSSQIKSNAVTEKAYFAILTKLIGSRFYQSLRTQQQLGYIVGVQNLSTRNTPILGLLVQSPNKSTRTIINAMEAFLEEQKKWLPTVPQDTFDDIKHSLLNELSMKAKNLSDNALEEWHQIAKTEPDFDAREEWIKEVGNIKRKDFIAFISHKLALNETVKIMTHNKPFPQDIDDQSEWKEANTDTQNL
ncbi:insulinase family protein [Marinomonas sp. A79]|uniref:Protease 3 n=1 Tax=Marinomonas vulgaris TaxID=2823372 RepID=A0ABS5H7Y8_9GAMM|nr:insulinase family protein [Marinomonas vulgaris]MBR7887818.1 insulinase family protein [Marinomonas vulgaris]